VQTYGVDVLGVVVVLLVVVLVLRMVCSGCKSQLHTCLHGALPADSIGFPDHGEGIRLPLLGVCAWSWQSGEPGKLCGGGFCLVRVPYIAVGVAVQHRLWGALSGQSMPYIYRTGCIGVGGQLMA
jgi:hypothetical protein